MSRSKHGYPSYDMNTNNTYLLSDLCLAFIVIEVSPATQTVMTEYIYILLCGINLRFNCEYIY